MIFYMTVDTCIYCSDCPNRLFNTGRNIEIGIGCITADTVIVIPRAYAKESRDKFIGMLKAMWLNITDYELLEQCYVTYDIKCPKHASYNVSKDANMNCVHIMNRELIKVPFRFMIVFGRAFHTVFPYIDIRQHVIINDCIVLYIPLDLTKLDNTEHINVVKSKLAKAIKYFNNKRIMKT